MNRLIFLFVFAIWAMPSYADTVLITGANRGIGLEFAKQYATHGWKVIATARTPSKARELNELAKLHENVFIEKLDVTKPEEISALAIKYSNLPIDVLLNNAGILGDYEKQKFGQFDYDELDRVMEVNFKGPIRVASAFLENVVASDQKKIVTIASALGSVTMGPNARDMYWYKASKAAMSITMGTMQNDLKDQGVTVLRLGPGMVNTRLLAESGAGGRGIEPAESVAGMIAVIGSATPETAIDIFNYDGRTMSK